MGGGQGCACSGRASSPPLIQAMRDKAYNVRLAASKALWEVVKGAPALAAQVLPPLIQAMRDKASYVREAASKALGEVSLPPTH